MELSEEYTDIFRMTIMAFFDGAGHHRKYEGKQYSIFLPVIGRKYPEKRIMLVGRACNSWCKPYGKDEIEPLEGILREITNNSRSPDHHCPMSWVATRWDGYCKDYNIKRSSFWRVQKLLLREHFDISYADWPSYLFWSNLMKISPFNGGNPDQKEWSFQLEYCKKLFKMELEEMKPDYVFLITGVNWAQPFMDYLETDLTVIENSTVKLIAKYKSSKIIITGRPEGKKDTVFVNNIREYLS